MFAVPNIKFELEIVALFQQRPFLLPKVVHDPGKTRPQLPDITTSPL